MSMESTSWTLEGLAARLEEVEQANAALQAEVAALRSAQGAASRPSGGRVKRPDIPRTSRRKLLQLGGAAAAATVAAGMLGGEQGGTALAASARADTITFQQSASDPGNTAIEGDGTNGASGVVGTSDSWYAVHGIATSGAGVKGEAPGGFGVWGSSSSSYGVYGASNASFGVYGISTNGEGVHGEAYNGYGVHAVSGLLAAVSATSTNGNGVEGTSTNGYGGSFTGGLAALWLGPSAGPGAPGSNTHATGEIHVDSDGVMWVCVAYGTPGTWVRLTSVASGASGGALTFLSTPIRLLDTRPSATGAAATPGVPIQSGAGNTFHLPVAGVSFGGVTIPTGAKALVGNCTVVNPAGVGDLAAYPDLLPLPNTAVMHYLPGQIVSYGITIGLGRNGHLAITALTSATDVIIDCQGIIS